MIGYVIIDGTEFVNLDDLFEVLEIDFDDRDQEYFKLLYSEEYLFNDENELRKPFEDFDFYVQIEASKTANKFFFVSKELSKLIALNSNSEVKKRYIQWLLKNQSKVDSFDLMTIDQVLYIIDLINIFKYVSHQKAAEKYHRETSIKIQLAKNESMSVQLAAKIFNKYRTKALDINKDDLNTRLLRFFDENEKYSNPKNRRDIVYILNKFGLIKIAVFDFLKGAEKPSEIAIKVGELAMKMAERMDIEYRQENVPDLFMPEKEVLNQSIVDRIDNKKLLK